MKQIKNIMNDEQKTNVQHIDSNDLSKQDEAMSGQATPNSKKQEDEKNNIKNFKIQQNNKKSSEKQLSSWESTAHTKFIQYWQTIFNRRIVSFSSFAIQIGDVVISVLLIAFLAFCCTFENDTKNSGSAAQIIMGICIIFGCRNGLLSYIFGLSLERAVLWHQAMAWVSLGLSLNHWFRSEGIMSGYLVQGVLILFIFFSLKPIRRYLWELFMKMHWILIILMIIGCIIHGVTFGVIAIAYFFLDVAYRMYTVYKHRNISKEMKLERIGENIVKLSMKKGEAVYKGGQYFFVMIPKLSYFQWHPFSVFSASYEDEIVIYIKSLGDWTSLLYKYAGEQGKPITVKGYLDGPYGSHSISVEGAKYQNFLCISGGIGVTPIISTAKEILHEIEQGRPVKNLHFVWTGRDSAIVESVLKADDLKSLIGQSDSQLLKTFYHYSDKGDKKLQDLEKQSLTNTNQIVQLQKGRPDFSKYFETAHKAALESGHHLVGVLTCGPQQLIDTAEIQSQKWSKNGIRFDVHQEVFNF